MLQGTISRPLTTHYPFYLFRKLKITQLEKDEKNLNSLKVFINELIVSNIFRDATIAEHA